MSSKWTGLSSSYFKVITAAGQRRRFAVACTLLRSPPGILYQTNNGHEAHGAAATAIGAALPAGPGRCAFSGNGIASRSVTMTPKSGAMRIGLGVFS